jgi:hypothetical protein
MKLGYLLNKFLGVDWGELYLGHGKHDIFVPTKVEPGPVFVSIHGKGGEGCGQSPKNTISYEKKKNGVKFHIQVGSDRAKMEWLVVQR